MSHFHLFFPLLTHPSSKAFLAAGRRRHCSPEALVALQAVPALFGALDTAKAAFAAAPRAAKVVVAQPQQLRKWLVENISCPLLLKIRTLLGVLANHRLKV